MIQKACVVFVADMEAQANKLGAQLKEVGYDVCLSEAALDDALEAQLGDATVTPEIEACLTGADFKIFLIPAKDVPPGLLGAAGQAGKMPGRLVAVCDAGASLPQVFDDIANSVVRIDSPDLLKAITSDDIHESLDGTPKAQRSPARVKCQ